jgi:hypothetical protein
MRMPLYVMMVEDSLGQSEVAVVCLLNSDEKPIIELFVRCFKENNPAFVNTKVIMVIQLASRINEDYLWES